MPSETKIRILVCRKCKTVDELPFVELPKGEVDTFIMRSLERNHSQCTQERGVGGRDPKESLGGDRFVAVVERHHWNNRDVRNSILKEVGAVHSGFEELAYAIKNTFQEDALKCYSAHRRPKDGCIDYKDQSKEVGNELLTDEEKVAQRKSGLLSITKQEKRKPVYLCDWCPVKSKVQEKVFTEKGLYG